MRTQFIVRVDDKKQREEFFDYICHTYKLKLWYPYNKEEFIASKFPFVVDFKKNLFWVCESITCLACASQAGVIFSVDDFNYLKYLLM